jgi:signal peptidase I
LGTRAAHAAAGPPAKSTLREYTETILICVIVFTFLRGFVFQHSEIPSGSMEDTVLPGDYILVNRFTYAPVSFDFERHIVPSRAIERGDVVVFRHPLEPERDFIKRVIGMPGDRVELRDGHVWVNGDRLDEPYINPLYREQEQFPPVRVPPGEYFMMGDHRNDSADSRRWGTVPAHLIKGQAVMVLFSTVGPPVGEEPGKVTITSTLRKLRDLVIRSRWDRAIRLIR